MIFPRLLPVLWITLGITSFGQVANNAAIPQIYHLAPSAKSQYELQDILVQAIPGDVIEFAEGKFHFERQIDIATDNITLRGQGPNETILSFDGQASGGQGIEATGDNFVVEGLAVENTAGNAIKVMGSRNVVFRHVRVEWTGEAKASNGAYGLYPVQCSNVLIESCIARGASDSGIYVGQSRKVIVRNCRAERNVAGIEIENTVHADVYDNVVTNNAGGLLVFDLPGLQLKAGKQVRVFRNQVVANNHPNFAAAGNIVAMVPPGTGVMVMATDQVEIFENEIQDNQTSNISIVSYFVSGKKIQDPSYDPFCKQISIHDNHIARGGTKPGGALTKLLVSGLGSPFPDILFDGAVNPATFADGVPVPEQRLSIRNNGDIRFANFRLLEMTPENLQQGKYAPSTNLQDYATPYTRLAAVNLEPHTLPAESTNLAALVYRTVPKRLSEYGLFEGNGAAQVPAEDVLPYALNTPLFSDYTDKYRFLRVPPGTSIGYTEQGILEFSEGTLMAKTFAYPIDASNPALGQQLLETRVEILRDGAWYGFAYQWNREQTEAHLLLGGGVREVSWKKADGQVVSHRYEIPNANQCLNCHSADKAYVPLGPTAMNMNRAFAFSTGTFNQLDYLADRGVLQGLPPSSQRKRLPDAYDAHTGSLDERAHAWLHVNCAHCHSPLGTARTTGLDLRFQQRDASKFGLWKAPVAAGHGSGGRAYDIVPGDPDQSILLYRLESKDPSIRMPSVARTLVPYEAVALIREWIAAMPKEK